MSASPRATLGLGNLGAVPLGALEVLFDQAQSECHGSGAWRARKRAEARELLGLCALAPGRLQLAAPLQDVLGLPGQLLPPLLDLRDDLIACVRLLDTPVPCRPDAATQELVIASTATMVIRYPEQALHSVIPGYHAVTLLWPRSVWHPNVFAQPSLIEQPLCLGPGVLPGIRLKELVLLAFRALTMQQVGLDEFDPAGVMNPEAVHFFQAPENRSKIPLSRASFLQPTGGNS